MLRQKLREHDSGSVQAQGRRFSKTRWRLQAFAARQVDFLGKGFAQDFLQQLKKPNDQQYDAEIAGAARRRLEDLIPKMRARAIS